MALSLPRIVIEFSVKPAYSAMVGKKSNLWCLDPYKIENIPSQKVESIISRLSYLWDHDNFLLKPHIKDTLMKDGFSLTGSKLEV